MAFLRKKADSGASCCRREFVKRSIGIGTSLLAVPSLAGRSKLRAGAASRGTDARWPAHAVARIPHGYQVAVADVNADGRLDILALSSEESLVEWYENPSWKARAITTKTRKNISLAPLAAHGHTSGGVALAADFDLQGSTHGGALWWAQPAGSLESEWSLRPIGGIPTSHRLRWADLDGDGRPELVDVPILGYGARAPDYRVGAPLTWFELPEEILRGRPVGSSAYLVPWRSHPIDDSLTVVHGAQAVDWDGDGRDEILTASFEGVHLFHSAGRGENLHWTKTQLATGAQPSKSDPAGSNAETHRGSSEVAIGRAKGRRFLATIEPWHGEQVAVYFEREPGRLWDRHVIDTSLRDGHALACGDFDGDGNDEIVAGFRGPGTSLYLYHGTGGPEWERHTLDTDMAASGVVVADVNGDGRLDIVAVGASSANVKWYENPG